MKFRVHMRTRNDGAGEQERSYDGTVVAHSLLNAVGQACLQFKVRTDAIRYLSVEELDEVREDRL